jgi:hypothetical protein
MLRWTWILSRVLLVPGAAFAVVGPPGGFIGAGLLAASYAINPHTETRMTDTILTVGLVVAGGLTRS